ncbi:hypothetical protein [Neisseria sicca]|uniref:hypothetical protein n=1 Tax=Neisseria sicca TaxID=490 RepID=UPI003C7782AC
MNHITNDIKLSNKSIFFKDLFYKTSLESISRDDAGSGEMKIFAQPQLEKKSDTEFKVTAIADVSSSSKEFILTASIWVKFELSLVHEELLDDAKIKNVVQKIFEDLVYKFIQDFTEKTPFHMMTSKP